MILKIKKISKYVKRLSLYRDKKIRKEIQLLLETSRTLIVEEKFGEAAKNDLIIVNRILMLSEKEKKENNYLSYSLCLYMDLLAVVARYRIDEVTDNESINVFTEFFLENSNIIKKIFTQEGVAKIIISLIVANLQLHRISNYEKIYSIYKNCFNNYNKIKLFRRLIKCYSGKINLTEEILPELRKVRNKLDDYKFQIEEFQKKKDYVQVAKIAKRNNEYIKNVIALTDNLNINVGKATGIVDINKYICVLSDDNSTTQGTTVNSLNEMWQIFCEKVLDKNYSREMVYIESKGIIDCCEKYLQKEKDKNKRIIFSKSLFNMKVANKYAKYWAKFEGTLNIIKSNNREKDVFVFVNEWSLVNATVSLPILMEARRRGYTCISTSPRTCNFGLADDEEINSFAGCIVGTSDLRYEKNNNYYDWEIDISNRVITNGKYNIYQPIFEYISRYQFTYFYDYNDAWARANTIKYVDLMDTMIHYCEDIHEWALKNNKKVYFVSNAPHLPVAAAVRIYCEVTGYNGNLNYICVNSGYDNYFNNIGDAKTQTLTAVNLTKNPDSRNSFLGTKKGFEDYYKRNINRIDEIEENVKKWLDFERSKIKNNQIADYKKNIINRIIEHKEKGGNVYLLIGKVILDLAVKSTQGCAHDDMSHWITHTVEYINKNPNNLLIIKPHPHETLESLTLTSESVARLKDIIKTEMGDNVIYLDSVAFKTNELTPYINMALLWNGTSCVELAAQGIPVLMDDIWGHCDYPIGFYKVKSIEEYEKILNNPLLLKEPNDLRNKAMVFLEYMSSSDVRIINKYSRTTTLNTKQFESEIFEDAVDEYIINGDSELERLFDSIL